jgi:hypothetical protein
VIRKIWKFLPVFVYEWAARRNCPIVYCQGIAFHQADETILVKAATRTPKEQKK